MKRNTFSLGQDLKSNLSNGQTVKTAKILCVSVGPKGNIGTHFGGWPKSHQLRTSTSETLRGLGSKYPLLASGAWACFSMGRHHPKNKIKELKEHSPLVLSLVSMRASCPGKGEIYFSMASTVPRLRKTPGRISGHEGTITERWGHKTIKGGMG